MAQVFLWISSFNFSWHHCFIPHVYVIGVCLWTLSSFYQPLQKLLCLSNVGAGIVPQGHKIRRERFHFPNVPPLKSMVATLHFTSWSIKHFNVTSSKVHLKIKTRRWHPLGHYFCMSKVRAESLKRLWPASAESPLIAYQLSNAVTLSVVILMDCRQTNRGRAREMDRWGWWGG